MYPLLHAFAESICSDPVLDDGARCKMALSLIGVFRHEVIYVR